LGECRAALGHDPEKWKPIFRKDHDRQKMALPQQPYGFGDKDFP
jgi:hypothetical protein